VTETPTAPEESAGSAGPAASAGPAGSAKKPRGRESVGDMVRSLSLVLVVVAVVFLLTLRDEPHQTVQRVGYSEQLQDVRRVASYDVLAPVGLGAGWKSTSVRTDNEDGAVTWHIGFVTPDSRYAGLEQSDGPASAFRDEFVDGARKSGDVTISGATWQRLEGGKPELRALVLRASGVSTIVTGSASFAELRQLAGALRGG
jgi:Protein of unknown function (DUF4245)